MKLYRQTKDLGFVLRRKPMRTDFECVPDAFCANLPRARAVSQAPFPLACRASLRRLIPDEYVLDAEQICTKNKPG